MKIVHQTTKLCLASFILGGFAPLNAAELNGLVTNSPFGGKEAVAAQPVSNFEFRGMVQEGDVLFFNIYDQQKKTASWLALDGESAGLKVEKYDATTQQLSLRDGTRQLQLTLKQAVVTLVAAEPEAKALDSNSPSGFVLAPDEKANLQKIAEEIRRRRELRSQSTQNPPAEKNAEP